MYYVFVSSLHIIYRGSTNSLHMYTSVIIRNGDVGLGMKGKIKAFSAI